MKKSARIISPGRIDIYKETEDYLKTPPAGWVTIQVKASGVCGTDVHIYKGEYIGSYPIVPGHEFSGVVTAVGAGVSTLSIGDHVAVEPNISCGNCPPCRENRQHFCRNWQAVGVTLSGGMATHVTAPCETVFPIGKLTFEEGAFMEPLSCVLHGVERLNPSLGDRILLAGAGPIGLLLLRVLKQAGAVSVHVLEKRESRRIFARQSGSENVFTDFSALPEEPYDAVVDATGVPAVMEQLIHFVRPAGKVLLFGVSPKDASMTIKPFDLFSKELTILSSFTSLRNSRQALMLMQSGSIPVSDLVSHRFALEDFSGAMEMGAGNEDGVMKIMVVPDDK